MKRIRVLVNTRSLYLIPKEHQEVLEEFLHNLEGSTWVSGGNYS